MNAARMTDSSSTTTSIGDSTRVSDARPKTWEISTSTGASTRAISIGRVRITEQAYDDSPPAASCTPTTFSIALPAIATTTSPANVSFTESAFMAGWGGGAHKTGQKAGG